MLMCMMKTKSIKKKKKKKKNGKATASSLNYFCTRSSYATDNNYYNVSYNNEKFK